MSYLKISFRLALLLLFLCPSLGWSQSVFPIKLEEQYLSIVEKNARKPDVEGMDLAIYGREIYLLYAEGKSLYLRSSMNGGQDWKQELIRYLELDERAVLPVAVHKTSNGYLHLFYFRFVEGQKQLFHRVKTNPILDWFEQSLPPTASTQNSHFDLAVEEDCSGTLYVAYTMGDGKVYEAAYKQLKWTYRSLAFERSELGIALSEGFDRVLHLAVAEANGDLHLATRDLDGETYTVKEVGESGSASCSLGLTADGGLLLGSTAFVSGRNKPLQISKRDAKGNWEHRRLASVDSLDFQSGLYKNTEMFTDRSGRVHLAAYLNDYKRQSNKAVVYAYSDNHGKDWRAMKVSGSAYGFPHHDYPRLAHNQDSVYLAFKNADRKFSLLRLEGVRLRGMPPCLRRINEVHQNQAPIPLRENRIVKEAARPIGPVASNPEKRPSVQQAEFRTRDDYITLSLWDNKKVDGDTISVFFNGALLLDNYGLQSKAYTLRLELGETGRSELLIFALSEGKLPPCTVSIKLSDSGSSREFTIDSGMEFNGTLAIVKN